MAEKEAAAEEYSEPKSVGPVAYVSGIITELTGGGYEYPPYTVVNTFEVEGGKKFEERKYEGGKKWVFVQKTFKDDNEAKKMDNSMFMSLFNYITGKNETGAKIPMTVPVSMLNKMAPDGEMRERQMAFYIDKNHQENPPKPNNPDVDILTRPEITVYTRTVGGFMSESKWKKELEELDAMIEAKGLKVDKSHYYTNGYDAPFKLWNRRNEVWRVKMEEQ